jgi:rare lipoprotein A
MLAAACAALLVCAASAQANQGTQEGQASYFNGGQNGHTETASGAPVNPQSNTAASRTLPLGSKAAVTNERNGKSTDVTVTDRGPTRTDRVMDVSKATAQQLGMEKSGTAPVKITPDTNGK